MPYTRPQLEELARNAAENNDIPVEGFFALINQESGWNPAAVSPAGARGIAQFMPATADDLNIDPMNPAEALPAAAEYLAWIKGWLAGQGVPNDWDYVLASYNAGIGTIRTAWRQWGSAWKLHIPAETQNYVAVLTPSFYSDTPDNGPSVARAGFPLIALVLLGLAALSASGRV